MKLTSRFSKIQYFLLALGLVYFVLQIPFIKADPDIKISWSRGANTDEGLHSSQIRNFIHLGKFDLTESDNFVKTPLFGSYLYLPLLLFGTSLSVARWAILFPFFIIPLWVAWRNNYLEKLLFLLIPLTFLEYHIFQFAHFSLAEMPSILLIFSGLLLYSQPIKDQQVKKRAWNLAILFALPIFLKIQFLYIAPLLPFLFIFYLIRKNNKNNAQVKTLFFSCALFIGFLLVYLLLWYFPNQTFFDYVMKDQTSDRFVKFSEIHNYLRWLNKNVLLAHQLRPVTVGFYSCFPIGVILFFQKSSPVYKKLFLGLSLWFLLETHKLTMLYLPTRYLVSLIFCASAINALVIFELGRICFLEKKYRRWIFIPTMAIIGISYLNLKNYSDTYARRTFEIRKMNQYLSQFDFDGRPIIGAWAPSLTWKSNGKSYPVWDQYFNYENVLNQQKPAIIISEINEDDSNQAYQNQNIQIDQHADSIKYFQIHNYKLKLLWMK